jgi:5-methylcytosine-specific restriction endonuclease McrA
MRRLWKAARGFCTYCLAKLKRWEATIDHMTPLSRGGTSEPWNLTLACVECNLDKGSLTSEEYMRMRYA